MIAYMINRNTLNQRDAYRKVYPCHTPTERRTEEECCRSRRLPALAEISVMFPVLFDGNHERKSE